MRKKRLFWVFCSAVIAATVLDALFVGSDWSLVGVGILAGVAASVPIALLSALPGRSQTQQAGKKPQSVLLIEAGPAARRESEATIIDQSTTDALELGD